jgi:GTPase SAR1 family protein
MTKAVIQPLESYRLIQYSTPIPCYICEADNTMDAEFCNHCFAPMALAHQASSQKVQPKMVAVIGPSGVGKTVYLGMLMDMLSQQTKKLQMFARGAFSITLQQTAMASLSRCEFPRKTPNEPDRWNWVHCQIRMPHHKHGMELIMPDMAGEAVLEEVDHPHTYRIVQQFLQKCSAAVVMIDAVELQEGNRDQDFFVMKLLSYLSELDEDPRKGWRRKPLAIVLTKADSCEDCWENPDEYAKEHANGLWQQCRERFHNHRFFSTGVVGNCIACDTLTEGRIKMPLRIEPRGVTEPFEWLLEKLCK